MRLEYILYDHNTYFLSSPVSQTCLIDLYRKMTEHFRLELFDDSDTWVNCDSTIVNVGPLFTSGILLPEKYLLLVANYFNYKVIDIMYVF
jgi:hypothetical protein